MHGMMMARAHRGDRWPVSIVGSKQSLFHAELIDGNDKQVALKILDGNHEKRIVLQLDKPEKLMVAGKEFRFSYGTATVQGTEPQYVDYATIAVTLLEEGGDVREIFRPTTRNSGKTHWSGLYKSAGLKGRMMIVHAHRGDRWPVTVAGSKQPLFHAELIDGNDKKVELKIVDGNQEMWIVLQLDESHELVFAGKKLSFNYGTTMVKGTETQHVDHAVISVELLDEANDAKNIRPAVGSGDQEPPTKPEAMSPRKVSLRVISAWFDDFDREAVKKHIAPTAELRDQGPGSMLKAFEHQTKEAYQTIKLQRVIFFDADDVQDLEKEYPSPMWNRLQPRLGDGLGTLVLTKLTGQRAKDVEAAGGKNKHLIAVVTKQIAGRPQIVYLDPDN